MIWIWRVRRTQRQLQLAKTWSADGFLAFWPRWVAEVAGVGVALGLGWWWGWLVLICEPLTWLRRWNIRRSTEVIVEFWETGNETRGSWRLDHLVLRVGEMAGWWGWCSVSDVRCPTYPSGRYTLERTIRNALDDPMSLARRRQVRQLTAITEHGLIKDELSNRLCELAWDGPVPVDGMNRGVEGSRRDQRSLDVLEAVTQYRVAVKCQDTALVTGVASLMLESGSAAGRTPREVFAELEACVQVLLSDEVEA